MTTYTISDGNGELVIDAESAQAACKEWADTGDFGGGTKTTWVTCRATPLNDAGEPLDDESESHTIEVPPAEPDCCGGAHDWLSPLSVVGGCEENPGVYGSGGGVVMTEVCRHCGRYQVTDTWAQNPENSEQGLTSVEYREQDEISEAWMTRRYEAAEKYVREHADEDDLEGDDLERHFANYFRRPADDNDRKNGLWSLLCQAVGWKKRECRMNKHAQAMGRLGGRVKSAAKARAVRENGRRGGRPGIPFVCPQCGGEYFGRDTADDGNGGVKILRTVRCHAEDCGWRGQWPPRKKREIQPNGRLGGRPKNKKSK